VGGGCQELFLSDLARSGKAPNEAVCSHSKIEPNRSIKCCVEKNVDSKNVSNLLHGFNVHVFVSPCPLGTLLI
jgi:hypothetical protein